MKRKIIYFLCFTFIFLIFKNYNLVLNSTILAIEIWLYKVFPYLFIMIVINDLLINLNFASYFKNTSIYVFVMSLLSGTPSSAYITSNLVKNGSITKSDGNTILLFTYFNNPLFLYSILFSIFGSIHVVVKIMAIHYFSNILIYVFNKKKLGDFKYLYPNSRVAIAESIKKAMNTTIMVLGVIVFYLVVSNILFENINLPNYISLFLRGIIEVTQGLNALVNNNILGKEILAVIFISFGGLSIHTQVKCILDEENLDYKYFLMGRIWQTIFSVILIIIFS